MVFSVEELSLDWPPLLTKAGLCKGSVESLDRCLSSRTVLIRFLKQTIAFLDGGRDPSAPSDLFIVPPELTVEAPLCETIELIAFRSCVKKKNTKYLGNFSLLRPCFFKCFFLGCRLRIWNRFLAVGIGKPILGIIKNIRKMILFCSITNLTEPKIT